MTIRKPPDPEALDSQSVISEHADNWIRQFTNQLEEHFLDAGRDLPPNAGIAELWLATARAILATFIDSGMEFESALELFGQAAAAWRSVDVAWTDELNQRRFALIDKEIQGALTPAESIELAGLTRIMRNHAESETNLPMSGARPRGHGGASKILRSLLE